MKQKVIQISAIFLLFILILSGCASQESATKTETSTSLDPGLLMGLWKIENMDSSDFFQYKYVEIKENEICTSWSETDITGWSCNQYTPYVVEGYTLKLGTPPSPFYKAKFVGEKLELETISKAVPQKKRLYIKVK